MSEELQIIQPNAITTAKYDYTAVQKNILYQMVGQLQDKMTNNKMNRDLFGSYCVIINIAEIAGYKNHSKVYEAAEELISKKFHYNWKKENGREGKTTTALVSSVTHEKNSRYLELKIPAEIVPILLYIGEGFTKYQKTIALTLKSVHAKRMYEMCNRWRDLGAFRCTVDEFKEMMCLDDKYEKISMLKSRVLDAAKKELDESADVSFEYSMDKNGTRQFSLISFKIIEKKKVKQEHADAGLATEDMVMVYNMLSIPYPAMKDGRALELSKKIAEHAESKVIYARIASLRKELKDGKKKQEDLVKLLPYILKTDYGLN